MTAEENETRGGSSIQVLARAAEALRLLHRHPHGLNQAEVSSQLGLARSTTSRLLIALEAEGLVTTSGPRGRYRLGPEIVRLADTARRSAWLDLRPRIVEFSARLGETIDLSVLEGSSAVFVDQVVADNRLSAVSRVGDAFPLHSCANGKALLAALPEPKATRLLAGTLERFTPATITDPTRILEELALIRGAGGIAVDREEHTLGVCALGAVISGVGHDPVAVSIPVPTQRFTVREPELRRALGEFVAETERWLASGDAGVGDRRWSL